MSKSYTKVFLYFTTAVLVLSVLTAGVSGGQAGKKTKKSSPETTSSSNSTDTNAKVDLNTASAKELDSLPGVGSATAKKIIAGRPYSSVDDLSKTGIPAGSIKKIAPLVVVSGGAAAAASPKALTPTSQPSPAAPSQPVPASRSEATSSAVSQGTPGPGTVWVNISSGVYHYSGSQFYGKTKSGKYMSEADAVKAGYRPAKNEKKPQ